MGIKSRKIKGGNCLYNTRIINKKEGNCILHLNKKENIFSWTQKINGKCNKNQERKFYGEINQKGE